MAWAPLLNELAGCTVQGCPVELPGYRLLSDRKTCFPQLQKGEGSVPGLLLTDLSAGMRERIGYFASGLGYVDGNCEIVADAQAQEVPVFLPRCEPTTLQRDWHSEGWSREWGQIALNAVGEVCSISA